MKKEKEIHASFAVASQTIKFKTVVCDMCLDKMENSSSLYIYAQEKYSIIDCYYS
jgi:hypothetical protein